MDEILKQICALPTAPFAEAAVWRWITAFCRKHRLHLSEDRFGNLLIQSRPARGSRWVMVAHMDHPGMVARDDLKFPAFVPSVQSTLQKKGSDMFKVIRKSDVLLHHPFQSFKPVIDFIQQAASEPIETTTFFFSRSFSNPASRASPSTMARNSDCIRASCSGRR